MQEQFISRRYPDISFEEMR